jgi:ATP-dependent exoDNAse (exonuclease V) beta subunit
VQRIKELLADADASVYDRHRKTRHRIKAGDIALICPRNKRLEQYADILRSAGIAVQMDEDGWLESRPVSLLFHALSYVADPHDKHAALYMSVTELGEDTLESALKTLLQNNGDVTHLKSRILEGLDELAQSSAGRSVEDVVQDVISALDLYTIVAEWPEASRHRANILRFEAEARDFERANREALASAGFYGHGLKTFLAWLQERTQQQDGNKQPGIGGANEDAVELVSWHRSKGREWPVVVLAACETEIIARVPDQGVSYADFSDLGAILDNAWVDISPEYAAPEKEEPFLDQIKERSNDSAKRLLYVALSRAREKVILEWPVYLDNGKERKSYTYWELLTERTGLKIDTNTMSINNNTYPCRVIKAGKEPVDVSVSSAENYTPLPEYGRRALKPGTMPQHLTPEAVRPSVHDEEQGDAAQIPETAEHITDLQEYTYAQPLNIDIDLPPTDLGTLLHRAFEIMQFDCSHTKLNRATGFSFTPEQYNDLHQQAKSFYTWVQNQFNIKHLHAEASILATDKNGSVISGYVDLLIETEEGYWIIDHKTDKTDDLKERFTYYLLQLQMYADAIRQQCPDKPVLGVGVNWVRDGVVMVESIEKVF